MSISRFCAAMLMVVTFSFASSAQTYTYTCDKFNFIGPTNESSNSIPFGNALNDSDTVVGQYEHYQAVDGFLRSSGVPFTTYLIPGSTGTSLGGINDAGEVVGSYTHVSQYTTLGYAFSSLPGEPLHNIIYPGAESTFATGINNRNQIVGYYYPETGSTQGFILSDSNFQSLAVPGAELTEPLGINDSGVVVGTWLSFSNQAFISNNGTYTLEYGPQGSGETFFSSVNDHAVIAGYYLNTNVSPPVFQCFVFSAGNYYIMQIPNATSVETGGINNKGDITGGVTLTDGTNLPSLGPGATSRS